LYPSKSFNKHLTFHFQDSQEELVLIGYPHWKAFVTAKGANIWIEVIPKIDLKTKSLVLYKSNNPKGTSTSTDDDLFFDHEKLERFFSTIPKELINLISPFQDSHWDFIKAVLLIGEDFLNLLKQNPVLAYLIVNLEKLNPSFTIYSSMDMLQRMITTKRKEIFYHAGFPEAESMIKIFRKIKVETLEIALLKNFRDVFTRSPELTERILHVLSFSKTINKQLLLIISDYPKLLPFLSDNVVYELSRLEEYKSKIADIIFIYKKSLKWKLPILEITSLDVIPGRKEKLEKKVKKLRTFPEPPIPGNEFIQPIFSEGELISWSKRQNNCARHYSQPIHDKKKFIYKAITPTEEATIEVMISTRSLRLGQIKSRNNCSTTPALYAKIREWFEEEREKRKSLRKKKKEKI
jgi:hypothetical protein